MSLAFATLRSNIRTMIRDTDPQDYAVRTDELNREIISAMQKCSASGMKMTTDWVSTASLNAGDTSALSAADARVMLDVRLSDKEELLERLSQRDIEREMEGSPQPTGRPTSYWLSEDSAAGGQIRIHFNRRADQDYTIDSLYVAIPSDSTTSVIPESLLVLRAIESLVAAMCLKKMTDEDAARLKINRAAADDYLNRSLEFLSLERERNTKMQAVAHIAPAVW